MDTKSRRSRYLYFTALCVTMYMACFVNTIQGVMLTDFIEYYALESYRQGLISTFQGVGSFLAIVLIVLFSSRVRKRTMLALTAGCLFVSVLAMGFQPPFAVLLLSYLILGIGIGANSVVTSALTADLFANRGSVMGLSHAAFGLGGLTGPLMMNRLLSLGLKWHTVIIAAAWIAFAGFAYVWGNTAYTNHRLPEEGGVGQNPVTLPSVLEFLKSRQNLLLLAGILAYSAVQNSINAWIRRYMTVMLDAADMGALTLAAYWLGTMLSRLTVPRLKYRRLTLLCGGCVGMAACTAAINFAGSPAAVLALILLSSLLSGATVPITYTEACSRYAKNTLAASVLVALFYFIGNIAAAPVTAAIMDADMAAGMYFLAAVGLAAGLACLAGRLLKEPSTRCYTRIN